MKFEIFIERVDNLHGINIISGKSNAPMFRGTISDGKTRLEVLSGYNSKLDYAILNCISNNATKDLIGKTFYSVA